MQKMRLASMKHGFYILRFGLELSSCKTVLNIKESKYGTWEQKTYKNCRLIDLK